MTVPQQAAAEPAAAAAAAKTVAPPVAATLTDEERALLKQKRIAVFGSFQYVVDFLREPLATIFDESKVTYFEVRLKPETAPLAKGYDAVCIFVNDRVNEEVCRALEEGGVKFIALRCAGFDKVDLEACKRHGLRVMRVPAYSPRSVAEHALALTFSLARNLHLSHQRVCSGNYALSGLVGFEVSGKTVGVVGTGKIGVEFCTLLKGFGCTILAHDVYESEALKAQGVQYVPLEQLMAESDIVSLHCPLMASTFHIVNAERLALMKPTAILINVSRGGLVDTDALLAALQNGRLAGTAMDVYENEGPLFFKDYTRYSARERMKAWDQRFAALVHMPQVLITPHSAFLTQEALGNIADTTSDNLVCACLGRRLANEVVA
ncbi:hypothetical protein ABPG75_004824 [Micractinium tetrahymenae]